MLIKSLLLTCLVSTIIQVVEPSATLDCDKDKMTVKFDTATNVDSYKLEDSTDTSNCLPNAAALTIHINLHECGTTATHNKTHVIYENKLTGEPAAGSGGVISRGSLLVLQLKCAYAREGTTNVLQWTAGQAVVEVEELGVFTFTLEAYQSYDTIGSTLEDLLSPNFDINLRDVVYFKITMDAPNALTLSLNILHIIALDSSLIDSTTSNKYYIVQDGCKADSTYKEVSLTDNVQSKGFEFEAFNFADDGSVPVYIHAVVLLCETGDASCENICASRRRRNAELSGTTDSLSQQFNLYGGPYIVKEGAVSKGERGTVAGFLLIFVQFSLLVLGY